MPQSFSDDRELLPDEVIEAMSFEGLEDIAGIYSDIDAFDKVCAGSDAMPPLPRQGGEAATASLDLMFSAEAECKRLIFE